MNNIILAVMLLVLASSGFSQQSSPAPAITKQDYLKKTKKQKTTARIILGAGGALMMAGALVIADDVGGIFDPRDQENSSLADVLGYTGVTVAIASIPLFIAAGKNKNKAMSISFKNENAPLLQKNNIAYTLVPSLTFKIRL